MLHAAVRMLFISQTIYIMVFILLHPIACASWSWQVCSCLPNVCGCAVSVAGSTGSVNFTDYIEFQHSDDEAGDEQEELLHTNGVSSSGHAAPLDDWTWGKLLKDIWRPGTDAESARVNHAFTPEGGSGVKAEHSR